LVVSVFVVGWIVIGHRFGTRLRDFVRRLNELQEHERERPQKLERKSSTSVKRSAIEEAIEIAKTQSIERSNSLNSLHEIPYDVEDTVTENAKNAENAHMERSTTMEKSTAVERIATGEETATLDLDELMIVPPPSAPSPNLLAQQTEGETPTLELSSLSPTTTDSSGLLSPGTPLTAQVVGKRDFGDVVIQSMSRGLGVLPRSTSMRKSPGEAIRKAIQQVKSEVVPIVSEPVQQGLNAHASMEDEWDGSNHIHDTLGRRRASMLSVHQRSKSADPVPGMGRRGTIAHLRPMPSPAVDGSVLTHLSEDSLNTLLTMVSARGFMVFSIVEACLTVTKTLPNPYIKLQRWPNGAISYNQRGIFTCFNHKDGEDETRKHKRQLSKSDPLRPTTVYRTPNKRGANPVYNQDSCLTLVLAEAEPCMMRVVCKDEKTVLGGTYEIGYVDIDYRGIMASGAGEWCIEPNDFVTTMDQPGMLQVFQAQQRNLLALAAVSSSMALGAPQFQQIVWVCDKWFRTNGGAEVRIVAEFSLNQQQSSVLLSPHAASFASGMMGAGGFMSR
jgi:hypothetical protein